MQIIRPTEKIEVIESKKQCKTGSTGYLAYQQPLDIYNMCRSLIVFTKFGDKGKSRIEIMDTTTEMVDIASMKLTTKARETLKERITKSSIMPKHPDKYYTINSSMKKIPMLSKSIVNLDIWDFFGYICSLSLFVKYLSNNGAKISLPGKDGLSIGDVSHTDIVDVAPINLVNFIYLALNSKIPGLDAEGIYALYMEHFNNTHNRIVRLDDMYLLLSTLRESVLRYSNYIIESHRQMNSRIKLLISNKKGNSPLKIIQSGSGAKVKIKGVGRLVGPQEYRPYRSTNEADEADTVEHTEQQPRAVRAERYEEPRPSSTSSSSGPEIIRPPRDAGRPIRPIAINTGTWEMRREGEAIAEEVENR